MSQMNTMEILYCYVLISVCLLYSRLSMGIKFTGNTLLLEDRSAMEGERLLWNCGVDDIENKRLEWIIYDQPTRERAGVKQSFSEMYLQATLLFESVSRVDEGMYFCAVIDENDVIVLESRKATLRVVRVPLPMYPKCSARKNVYTNGEEAELSCCSEKTTLVMEFQWIRNDQFLIGNTDWQGNEVCYSHRFVVTKDHNKAIFNCTMTSDRMPTSRSCIVNPLNVHYKPEVQLLPVNITIGSQAILICKATANPKVIHYVWSTSRYFKFETSKKHVMVISQPDATLNGTIITCIAENEVGATSVSMVVHLFHAAPMEPFNGHDDVRATIVPSKTSSANVLSTVLLIAGSCTMIALLLMILPICYCFFNPRHNLDFLGRYVPPQPEVYFQAKEISSERVTKRSCAVQVPDDIISMYAELPCDIEVVDKV